MYVGRIFTPLWCERLGSETCYSVEQVLHVHASSLLWMCHVFISCSLVLVCLHILKHVWPCKHSIFLTIFCGHNLSMISSVNKLYAVTRNVHPLSSYSFVVAAWVYELGTHGFEKDNCNIFLAFCEHEWIDWHVGHTSFGLLIWWEKCFLLCV